MWGKSRIRYQGIKGLGYWPVADQYPNLLFLQYTFYTGYQANEQFTGRNHPCPLLAKRRGTRRVRLRDEAQCTSRMPISRAAGYGSPPFCKEGPGVVPLAIEHRPLPSPYSLIFTSLRLLTPWAVTSWQTYTPGLRPVPERGTSCLPAGSVLSSSVRRAKPCGPAR